MSNAGILVVNGGRVTLLDMEGKKLNERMLV